jgi:putative FmdB family regulatory protein
MPTYDYACEKCKVTWDVTKPMAEYASEEHCPRCAGDAAKLPSLCNIDKESAGSWNQQSYNPGLGCWTASTKHAEQIAKRRGLEPLGNEPVENIHKHYDKQREETSAKRWADDRVKLFD